MSFLNPKTPSPSTVPIVYREIIRKNPTRLQPPLLGVWGLNNFQMIKELLY
ncbi:hypothetical protein M595_1065 [Lyngbya aestuarii BL J]|uniref:Uncharacterized protein n=1 Tax=Lyngbya aestuarii BL J TaxID=1348334 RepID=U7QP53_9CYAN|nr:hypothetical protein M595_1065 [Lyngbya aestuarii BL J]